MQPSFRGNWNTAHPKPDINALIRRHSLSNWLDWNVAKAVFVASERDSHLKVYFRVSRYLEHHKNIITLACLKSTTRTSAIFFAKPRVTQLCRCRSSHGIIVF